MVSHILFQSYVKKPHFLLPVLHVFDVLAGISATVCYYFVMGSFTLFILAFEIEFDKKTRPCASNKSSWTILLPAFWATERKFFFHPDLLLRLKWKHLWQNNRKVSWKVSLILQQAHQKIAMVEYDEYSNPIKLLK